MIRRTRPNRRRPRASAHRKLPCGRQGGARRCPGGAMTGHVSSCFPLDRRPVDPTERAPLGRSGVRVSRLSLGMAALGDAARTSDDVAAAVLARTASLGLGYVDTAAEYGLGLAERRLGEALARLPPGTLTYSTKLGRLIRPAHRGYRIRHTLRETFGSRT